MPKYIDWSYKILRQLLCHQSL